MPPPHLAETGPRNADSLVKGHIYRFALVGGGCSFNPSLSDWRTDEVSPFGPRAVVVLHIAIADEVFQNEPSMRAAFANAAIGDHFICARDALGLVKLFQSIGKLEGAIFICGLRPWNVRRTGDVTGTLRRL